MKCGEICARSARSSACASRSSCSASADSSTCADTSAATSRHHARVLRPQPALRPVERGEPADPLAADDQRRDHRVAERVRPALAPPPARSPGSQSRSVAGSPSAASTVSPVVDQHARGLRQRVQVADRLPGRLAREPLAQVRERRRRGVQRLAHTLLTRREHPPRRRQPADREHRGGEHHAQQHAEEYVHAAKPKGARPLYVARMLTTLAAAGRGCTGRKATRPRARRCWRSPPPIRRAPSRSRGRSASASHGPEPGCWCGSIGSWSAARAGRRGRAAGRRRGGCRTRPA